VQALAATGWFRRVGPTAREVGRLALAELRAFFDAADGTPSKRQAADAVDGAARDPEGRVNR